MANGIVSKRPPIQAIHAKISHVRVYDAYEELEKNEGRRGQRKIGSFLHKSDASAAAKGQGVWGHDGPIREHDYDIISFVDPQTNKEVTRILGDVLVLQFENPVEVRKRALAKLSDEEKLALGLKDV